MTKILTATAIAATMLAGAAHAGDLPDYSDRATYTCDKDEIKLHMTDMFENGPPGRMGMRLLYVKDEAEVSRKPNELRCRVTLVTSLNLTVKGIFYYRNEDGHALAGWERSKGK
jgi:hypothetical protein